MSAVTILKVTLAAALAALAVGAAPAAASHAALDLPLGATPCKLDTSPSYRGGSVASMAPVADEALARAAVDGDCAAFAELYDRHEHRAFNLAYRICGAREDAAYATQEAFVKVLARLPHMAGRDLDFGSYLLTGRTPRELRRRPGRPSRRARRRPTVRGAARRRRPHLPSEAGRLLSCSPSPWAAHLARARGPVLRRDRPG